MALLLASVIKPLCLRIRLAALRQEFTCFNPREVCLTLLAVCTAESAVAVAMATVCAQAAISDGAVKTVYGAAGGLETSAHGAAVLPARPGLPADDLSAASSRHAFAVADCGCGGPCGRPATLAVAMGAPILIFSCCCDRHLACAYPAQLLQRLILL